MVFQIQPGGLSHGFLIPDSQNAPPPRPLASAPTVRASDEGREDDRKEIREAQANPDRDRVTAAQESGATEKLSAANETSPGRPALGGHINVFA